MANQTPTVVKDIVRKVVAGYSPERVVLFGSYATGTPDADSDIDLLIVKETAERFIDRWDAVQTLLADSTRRIPVETLVLTNQELAARLASGDQFVREILQKGREVYVRP